MKIETYLNALVKVSHKTYESNPECEIRLRQYKSFRAQILWMFKELEDEAWIWKMQAMESSR